MSDLETTEARTPVGWVAAVSLLLVVTTVWIWIDTEDPISALAPLLIAVLVWALARAPLRRLGIALFFLAIVVDNPKEHPAMGEWESPLHSVGVFLYDNLNTTTGIAALRFSGMDALLVLTLSAVTLRRRWDRGRRAILPIPRPLRLALLTVFAGLVAMELWGMARGGDFKSSLWQLRPPIWYCGIAAIFAGTIRDSRDFKAIAGATVVAALIKVTFGAYYYWAICGPRNLRPDYVTTHSDSVLFVTALVIVVASALEPGGGRRVAKWIEGGAVVLALLLGILINGRRLAYIEIVGAAVALFALPDNAAVRARVRRGVAITLVPAIAYLAVGWNSQASVFVPAAKIASLFTGEDRSAGTRDIENFNLIFMWREHPLLGSGMGHAYAELSRGDSIADLFPLYRFIGHDSVLWLFAVGGWIGFLTVWSVLVVGAYYAAIAHRASVTRLDRVAAASALAVIVGFMVQAYGDMGMQSWTAAFLLPMALVVAGKLAIGSGAWPRRATVRARSPRPPNT